MVCKPINTMQTYEQTMTRPTNKPQIICSKCGAERTEHKTTGKCRKCYLEDYAAGTGEILEEEATPKASIKAPVKKSEAKSKVEVWKTEKSIFDDLYRCDKCHTNLVHHSHTIWYCTKCGETYELKDQPEVDADE